MIRPPCAGDPARWTDHDADDREAVVICRTQCRFRARCARDAWELGGVSGLIAGFDVPLESHTRDYTLAMRHLHSIAMLGGQTPSDKVKHAKKHARSQMTHTAA